MTRREERGASLAAVVVMNIAVSKSLALSFSLALFVLPTAVGCAGPEATRESKGTTTSNISGCGDDEEFAEDEDTEAEPAAEGEADESDGEGLTTQRVRVRAKVCTPQNPTGEERCDNGGIPPRCEVLTQGPSNADNRAAACEKARQDAQEFVAAGPLQDEKINFRYMDALERMRNFCD